MCAKAITNGSGGRIGETANEAWKRVWLKVEVHWIKGHSTSTYNILADIYAGKARKKETFGYETIELVDNLSKSVVEV